MSKPDWKEHTRGHWEADHCGMCLHVFKSLNGSCWSVYDQVIEIDGRGAMMPFEKAQASAVAAAERWNGNAHFTAVRETFRVLESRGQAPDDNAPLSATVRRVLDYLDIVTAERDALKADNDAHIAVRDKVRASLGCEPHEGLSDASQRVVAERDALAAELAALKYSDSTLIISPMIPVTSSTGQPEIFEYDRMKRELAALRRRLANAERGIVEHYQDHHGDHVLCVACDYPAGTKVALVRLEDGVSETKNCGDGSPVPFEEK